MYFFLRDVLDFCVITKITFSVIPAKAGHVVTRSEASALTFGAIQYFQLVATALDSSRTRSGIYRSDDLCNRSRVQGSKVQG